ncbi:hypothetical protein vBSlqSZDD2_41 [Serratia phage vB_SlqS_ZDD2]|nr:hypothetical protein vBSlqSZDD2_41 [Serratia phage vB_SlqS_ZDD2]
MQKNNVTWHSPRTMPQIPRGAERKVWALVDNYAWWGKQVEPAKAGDPWTTEYSLKSINRRVVMIDFQNAELTTEEEEYLEEHGNLPESSPGRLDDWINDDGEHFGQTAFVNYFNEEGSCFMDVFAPQEDGTLAVPSRTGGNRFDCVLVAWAEIDVPSSEIEPDFSDSDTFTVDNGQVFIEDASIAKATISIDASEVLAGVQALMADGGQEMAHQFVNLLAQRIHESNVAAGWWPESGRNIPEVLCLIHSEISEAMEGYRKDLMDDHLPHRKMIEVELADAIIRILDLAGYFKMDIGGAISEKRAYNAKRADHKLENRAKEGGKKF